MEISTISPPKPLLPQNLEAEQALLGVILANNRTYEKVAEFLRADHFADPVHGRIYAAIERLIERGQMANAVTLKQFFMQDEALKAVGGAEYLARLEASVASYIGAADYGEAVFESFLRRELIEIGSDLITAASNPDLEDPARSQIEQTEQKLFNLATKGITQGGFLTFNDSLKLAISTAEKAARQGGGLTGITTGFRDMDKLLGGLHPSDLVILAARPSMGKTALATNIAFNAARKYLQTEGKEGGRVAFFSLEMSAEQLALRILSEQTEIPSEKIRRGEIRESDFPKFLQLSQELQRLHMHIDETPSLSVMGMRARARRLKRTSGLDLIVIDYLQLMTGSGSRRNETNRVLEVSEITRGLKGLAKELNVPIIALSQLSRKVEEREDNRPQLSDLRESGSIEQDADMVMFIYREEYYLQRRKPGSNINESQERQNERHQQHQNRLELVQNVAEVIVAKQRHGPIGTVKLQFAGEYTQFSDLDPNHPAYNDHRSE